jgi:hypothetical protein
VSLNAPVKKLTLYAPEEKIEQLYSGEQDIKDTLKIENIVFKRGSVGDSSLEDYPQISFTLLLDDKS